MLHKTSKERKMAHIFKKGRRIYASDDQFNITHYSLVYYIIMTEACVCLTDGVIKCPIIKLTN